MHPAQTLEQRQQKDTIHIKAKWLNMDDTWVCNHLPVVFHIAKWQDILYEHLPLIPELIKSKQEAVHQFYATMMEMKGCFACECLDRDFFWMPSIKTKSCRQLKHSVILSLKVNWFVRADEVKVKQVNESSC